MVKCKTCKYRLRFEFKRPTLTEVTLYASEIGWTNFDGEYFLAQHDRVGWITPDGRPILDWKAELRIWMMASFRRGDIKPTGGKTFKDMYNEHKM